MKDNDDNIKGAEDGDAQAAPASSLAEATESPWPLQRRTHTTSLTEHLILLGIAALASGKIGDGSLDSCFFDDAAWMAVEVLERLGPEAIPQTEADRVRAVNETLDFSDFDMDFIEAAAALVPYLADEVPEKGS